MNMIVFASHALSPSTRYRVKQFIPHLKRNKIKIKENYFIGEYAYDLFYLHKHSRLFLLTFPIYFLFALIRLIIQTIHALFCADLVFVQREVMPYGPPIFEALLVQKPFVYDIDDAIYNLPGSFLNQLLKCPWKVNYIIYRSKQIIAGNQTIKIHCKRYNKNVEILPTVVDITKYQQKRKPNKVPVIGWIGSASSLQYLEHIQPALKKINCPFILKIITNKPEQITMSDINVQKITWNAKTANRQLKMFDIGIMPLPNTSWAQAKCGLKAIEYAAMGMPSVVSPIGINKTIVTNKKTGFHAKTHADWTRYLSFLLQNKKQRLLMGNQAKQTAKKYSVQKFAPVLLTLLKKTIKS